MATLGQEKEWGPTLLQYITNFLMPFICVTHRFCHNNPGICARGGLCEMYDMPSIPGIMARMPLSCPNLFKASRKHSRDYENILPSLNLFWPLTEELFSGKSLCCQVRSRFDLLMGEAVFGGFCVGNCTYYLRCSKCTSFHFVEG